MKVSWVYYGSQAAGDADIMAELQARLASRDEEIQQQEEAHQALLEEVQQLRNQLHATPEVKHH